MYILTIIQGVIIYLVLQFLFSEEGYFHKKRIESRLDNIKYYQRRNNTDNISFTYREKEFSIRVEYDDNTAYYKIITLYINEEDVFSLHILTGDYVNCRTIWSHSSRDRKEVYKILKVASKTADKRTYNSIKSSCATKSYFK